jgi:hypothetical protein
VVCSALNSDNLLYLLYCTSSCFMKLVMTSELISLLGYYMCMTLTCRPPHQLDDTWTHQISYVTLFSLCKNERKLLSERYYLIGLSCSVTGTPSTSLQCFLILYEFSHRKCSGLFFEPWSKLFHWKSPANWATATQSSCFMKFVMTPELLILLGYYVYVPHF